MFWEFIQPCSLYLTFLLPWNGFPIHDEFIRILLNSVKRLPSPQDRMAFIAEEAEDVLDILVHTFYAHLLGVCIISRQDKYFYALSFSLLLPTPAPRMSVIKWDRYLLRSSTKVFPDYDYHLNIWPFVHCVQKIQWRKGELMLGSAL